MPVLGSKLTIIGIVLAVIITAIGFKYVELTSTIGNLTETVAAKDKSIQALLLDAERQKLNIIKLENAIEASNNNVERLASLQNESLLEIELWKNKPAEIKYKTVEVKEIIEKKVTVYAKGTCEDGLNLNKTISRMKYEDL